VRPASAKSQATQSSRDYYAKLLTLTAIAIPNARIRARQSIFGYAINIALQERTKNPRGLGVFQEFWPIGLKEGYHGR